MLAKIIGPFEQLGYDRISTPVINSAEDVLTLIIKKSFELPIGVDIKAFSKKKDIQRLGSPIRFIYVGAIARVRELDRLIEGIAIAKKSIMKKQSIEVDFFGTGDAVQQLKIQSENLNLSKTVNFKGELSQYELFKKMSEYDVGLAYIPQKVYNNSPGLKTLEYMAASLLVIASDTAGNRMFIRNNYNGILMDNSTSMIAEAILKSINIKNVKGYICNSYKIAQMYDWEKIVRDKLIPNYDTLIKN
jgi:glycosyltransferase involved in cell wall biosynthesis